MRVYIANLGKYNEGELVGDWFSFPIDEEDVAERIGLNSYYEEYAVHDTDSFPIEIGEYISIQELNEMYGMICELPDYITEEVENCPLSSVTIMWLSPVVLLVILNGTPARRWCVPAPILTPSRSPRFT